MTFRRWSSPAVLLLGSLAVACQTKTPPGTGLNFSLSSANNVSTVSPGGSVVITLNADNVAANGTSTGVAGSAALTVMGDGTLSSSTVTIDSTGTATVKFTMCPDTTDGGKSPVVSAQCSMTQPVTINGTFTAGSSTATSSLELSIPSSDGGSTSSGSDGGVDAGPVQNAFNIVLTMTNVSTGEINTDGRIPAGTQDSLDFSAKVTSTMGSASVSGLVLCFTLPTALAGSGAGTLTAVTPPPTDGGVPSSDCASFSGPNSTVVAVATDSNGVAEAQFSPAGINMPEVGSLDISVGGSLAGTGSATPQTISVVVPSVLVFTSTAASMTGYNPVMGVKGSGFQEESVLQFTVIDSTGLPYIGLVTVAFSVPVGTTDGGTEIPTITPTSQTINAGVAQTTLYSGTNAQTVTVTAVATATLSPSDPPIVLSTQSPIIAIVGAKANGRNMSMSCGNEALPALINNDCTDMHADLSTTCTMVLGDRYNNTLGVATQVQWFAESGLFGPPSTTPSATPGADPTTETGLGQTSNILQTKGVPIPENVDGPLGGFDGGYVAPDGTPEPTFTGLSRCGRPTTRPRDGLSTVIAVTQGEEGFIDQNGNNKWDPGEPFFDLGEPFVDSNDNNQYDPGEQFFDVNGNGKFDGPNGVWDANTTIWTSSRVAFTDLPNATWTPATIGPVQAPINEEVQVRFADSNGNESAPDFTSYGLAMFGTASGTITQDSPPNLLDQWGSMVITRPTVCGPSTATVTVPLPDGGTLDAGPACPNGALCDCVIPTEIYFNQRNQIAGEYSVGATVMPTGPDDIRATATVTTASNVITDNSDQFVTILPVVPDAGTGSDGGSSNTDAGTPDAGSQCLGATACSSAVCDQQVCMTSNGVNGACDSVSGTCEPGGLLVLEEDQSGIRLSPTQLPIGAPYVQVSAEGVPTSIAGSMVKFTVSPATLGGFTTTQPMAGVPPTTLQSVTVSASTNSAKVYFVPKVNSPAQGTFTVTSGGLTQTINVTFVVAGLVQFTPSASDGFVDLMGVQSSGFHEQNVLRFTVFDSSGNPVIEPATVQFSVLVDGVPATGANGPTISPTGITSTGATTIGQVTTTLSSGAVAQSLQVTATATLSSGAIVTGTSTDINVVGAKPAGGSHFSMLCDHDTINALVKNDCQKMTQDFSVQCTVVLTDRFGNILGTSAQIAWMSESGSFGLPTTTPTFSPGGGSAGLGRSTNIMTTLAAPLPMHVDNQAAVAGEPINSGTDRCGNKNTRPRDGLVTMIAMTQGEDEFVDTNGNGVYDSGENFFDLGEPYLDENDNSKWDDGEPFVDSNGNGKYDGPSGVWQANTTIWTVGHILYSDTPSATVSQLDPNSLGFGVVEPYTVTWLDENLNAPSQLDADWFGIVEPGGQGNFNRTNPQDETDEIASITLVTAPTCVGFACLYETQLTFPTVAPQFAGNYTAPSASQAPNGFDDTIQFSNTLPNENVTVYDTIQEDYQAVCDTSSPANVNCILPACAGKSCTVNGAPGACDATSSTCVVNEQASGSYSMSVSITNPDGTPSILRVAAGSAALTVTATLSATGGASVANQPVLFTLPAYVGTLAQEGNAMNTGASITVDTDSSGVATALLTPESTTSPQAGDLVVSYQPSGANDIVIDNVLSVVVPGELVFTSTGNNDGFFAVMGVKGSGFREQNVLNFAILDSSGQPYVASATVSFTLPQELNGFGIGGTFVTPASANTDQTGAVSTTLSSGTAAGTVAVTATAVVDITSAQPVTTCPLHHTCITLTGTSSTIAIIGAKANGRNYSVFCTPDAMPALFGNDCTFMQTDTTATCTVVIGDRYNNTLGVSQEVSWLTEAALFGPPSSTPAAVPGVDPTTEPLLGHSSNILSTIGAKMPENIDALSPNPYPTEPTNTHTTNCGLTGTRPRDGLNTIIAATQGEEGFTDLNGNGSWDPGEPFWDLGEPYVDSNDNNVHDSGEPFIDVNNNGKYDGPNGVWDSNTTIWVTGHVEFTGSVSADADDNLTEYRRWYPDSINSATSTGAPDILSNGSVNVFSLFWADDNMNQPAATSSQYGVAFIANNSGSMLQQLSATNYADNFGTMAITQPTSCTNGAQPICTVSTKITFGPSTSSTGVNQSMSDTASSPTMGAIDLIQATVTTSFPSGGSIVDVSDRAVEVPAAP